MIKYIKGDLIKLTLRSQFSLIAHGCNCQSKQRSGIAAQMVTYFGTDKFPMEIAWDGDKYNKLGCIDYRTWLGNVEASTDHYARAVKIVNCYTQYQPGKATHPYDIPLDYDALRMCMRKIAFICDENDKIGLPKIGCGLAGGDWEQVSRIIEEELGHLDVTIVEYEKVESVGKEQ